MSVCNPTHPNCLKTQPVNSGTRFCAGCGRSAAEIAQEATATQSTVSVSVDVSEPFVVSALDVVSDDDPQDGSVDTAQLDDVAFADTAPEEAGADDVSVAAAQDDQQDQIAADAPLSDNSGNIAAAWSGTSVVLPQTLGGGVIGISTGAQQTAPSVSLQSANSQLQTWASKWGCQNDPYVTGLSQAINNRDDLTMWASLSPREHLPRPDASARFGVLDLFGRSLSLIRNVLVFVPVAITWFAIGKASEAYGLFTQDNPDTPLNFLQFWQSGQYGGKEYLSTFWHIGDVARFDALLIGLIVVLTLVVGAIGAQRERSESKFEMAVDRERTALGLTLANALHGRRSASPESIGESLAEALNDLTQAARDVNDVAARLERATVGMDTLGPKLDVLNQHTDRLVGQSVQSITASMSALVSSVSQLNGAVATNVTQVFADATANLEEVSAQFSRIAASMELGAAQLREDLEHISRQVGNRGNR